MVNVPDKEYQALQDAGEWEATVDAIADGVSIHNSDYEILNLNRALCEMLGKKKEELIGKKCYRVFHGKDAPLNLCPLKKVLETKKRETMEYFEPTLNAWLTVSASPIFNGSGGKVVHRVVHVVRDITERKRVEEELAQEVKELEKTTKIMEGREDRIVELKNEIKKLKGL